MPFARLASTIRLTTAVFLFAALTAACWAQEPPAAPTPQNAPEERALPVLNYSQPVSHFPNPVGPYKPRHLAAPNLANTARIDQFMHDGKLYLSLNDAIALALENNLDIAIARYNLNIADTDVLRAKAGASILGVNAGVVLNTPGGGVGGIGATAGASTGGTSLGAGGIGGGTSGLVSSTLGQGPLITSFDPIFTSTLQLDRSKTVSSSLFNGVPILEQNTSTANFAYNQGFSWGTNLQVGFQNARVTSNVPFNTYSPVINSGLRLQLTQHLLQGAGFPANTRFIRIAKNNRELTDVAFRLQIIDSVEPTSRGPYGGAVGYLSFTGDLDTCIYIRSAHVKDGRMHVQAGGGIVADSEAGYEVRETEAKANAIFEAAALACSQPDWA